MDMAPDAAYDRLMSNILASLDNKLQPLDRGTIAVSPDITGSSTPQIHVIGLALRPLYSL